jgi:hypothetical protein
VIQNFFLESKIFAIILAALLRHFPTAMQLVVCLAGFDFEPRAFSFFVSFDNHPAADFG